VKCGESDPVVLEFDHIKGKEEEIARLIADGASIQRFEKEMSRCQVLCANCHRRKTSKDRGWFRSG
jgi:5-methylcytosine-specific restriction endonuclease McrA